MRILTFFAGLFLLLFITGYQTLLAQPSWPAITNQNKPWTRWWWQGSAVTKKDLSAAMEKYSKVGLGGLELTVIYGVKGYEDKFINYLSPEWMEMFAYTLKEGQRLDLGIDLANASGWPFGGPWVDPADACKNINHKIFTLKAGETLKEPVVYLQKPFIRTVGKKPEFADLVEPIGKNKNLQLYAIDQIKFEKQLPLVCLMAYSDAGERVDITGKVEQTGNLNWTAPAGNWTLYALFQGWHGKLVERAGPGGEGDVIDHFSKTSVTHYLQHFDNAFAGYNLKSLRGFFNDSYEVDDASGQSNWTPGLFNEFQTRRGYDLKNCLPALFGKDIPEKNARILCDYRETISELLLENYTQYWADWVHKQGKIIRNQAHGSPANILDLYAATDIPETEGSDILPMKFASSAANVTGKKLISSESATWLNEHFLSSLGDVKSAIDKYFLGGVNHIVYHGTCFSPQNEAWPGWLFYASVELTPTNSLWNHFPALNNYITHIQSFLQDSKPDNNILLYFPIFDRYSDASNGMLEHFNGMRKLENTSFKHIADTLLKQGYTFDFISDRQLKNVVTSETGLQTGGACYQTIVIPACKYIPLETFKKIISLVRNGASVIMFDKMPGDISGWYNLEARRDSFSRLKNELNLSEIKGIQQAKLGKGQLLMGTDIEALMSLAGVRRETLVDKGLQFYRKKTEKGSIYFIVNSDSARMNGWVPLQSNNISAAIYNPMTEKLGIAKSRSIDGKLEVYLDLRPGESCLVETYQSDVKGDMYRYYKTIGDAKPLGKNWKVKFIEGGPELPPPVEITALKSWTEFGGEAVKYFSGTAEYSIDFIKPAGTYDALLLDLGRVCESARIILNGKKVGTLIGPTYQIYIEPNLLEEQNTLAISVSNLMANRIAYLDKNGIEWKKFYNINFPARLPENSNEQKLFDASKWQLKQSGLLGPVSVTPVEY